MTEALSVDFNAIARSLKLRLEQVKAVVALLDDDNTVPFITRYRKEHTGGLDEEQIRAVESLVTEARQLVERKETVLRLIESQQKLTPELREAIVTADSVKRVDDLYLPFRPKRKTRASQARERGLEPLATQAWAGDAAISDLQTAAAAYVNAEQELPTTAEVLQGVSDIIAENVSEDAGLRDACRRIATTSGVLEVEATKSGRNSGKEFSDYFEHSEPVAKMPPHRVLAINRGEKAGHLKVKFTWNDARALVTASLHYRLPDHRFHSFLEGCVTDGLNRLVKPALERELRKESTEAAERHAVEVFAQNLRSLLLQPPFQEQRVVAVDPGFRTGCKLAALDERGQLLAHGVMHITSDDAKKAALETLHKFLTEHNATVIAIGNGTACRETEELVGQLITDRMPDVRYVIVNEAGASVYSAGAVAREEFPDLDATVRGTVSIGRRLQDPLSELVKIDPQHIGVGMYQHDVSPKLLQASLDQVIESCVNHVGVDLNVASASLLSHVSGLNQLVARRITTFRNEHGPFRSRKQLLEVSGVGEKTFTQAAGFLKVSNSENPLDATWIHPESYEPSQQILSRLEVDPAVLTTGTPSDRETLQTRLRELNAKEIAAELKLGEPTCKDILDALARPGRDPRAELPGVIFKRGVLQLDDLHEGIELQGTVLNVVDFGAFVDVGLKDSGLVHISRMANKFVRSPHEIVAVGDVVTVWVQTVDRDRKRVSLSMLPPANITGQS